MIEYEWVAEIVEDGDVTFTEPCETYADAVAAGDNVALVRDHFRSDVLVDRLWAYVAEGKLPSHFSGADGQVTTVATPRSKQDEVVRFHRRIK